MAHSSRQGKLYLATCAHGGYNHCISPSRRGTSFQRRSNTATFQLNAANWPDEAENAVERLGALTVGQKPGF
jgi:hypothetical protein